MAAPATSSDQWRRQWWRRDDGDLDDDDEPRVGEEEGEVVPGGCHSESETDTDEYYNRHSPGESDDEAVVSGRRGATSVDVPANIDRNAASTSSVARGWGGTGKRGRPGSGTVSWGRAASPSAEPDHHQTVAVVAVAAPMPVLQPVPLAFAMPSSLPASSVPMASAARADLSDESSSAQSVSVHDEATETVVAVALAGAAIPPAEAVAVHQQPVAPPRPAAGRQNPDGYTCPKCGKWFATHQGLGGHSVGHKHREREVMMLAVLGGRRDDAKREREERAHVCGDCGAEFATGVQLGGHKRKHWAGARIVPKKKPRAVVGVVVLDQHHLFPPPAGSAARAADDLALALAVKADEAASPAAAAPPAVETEPAVGTTTQPATRSSSSPVAGRVRLFGVDIVPAVQTPEARQGSPATGSSGGPPAGSSSHSQ